MTDQELADALIAANGIERKARDGKHRANDRGDGSERDGLDTVLRQAVALRKVLERQITTRATRALSGSR